MKNDSFNFIYGTLWSVDDKKLSKVNPKLIPHNVTDELPKAKPVTVYGWDKLINKIQNCNDCQLSQTRTNVVIERGSRSAPWLFLGDSPDEYDDIEREPFRGDVGILFDKMVKAMGLSDNDIYVCNAVKCKTPTSRSPTLKELQSCKNYLINQIQLVKPKIILAMGKIASQGILNLDLPLNDLRQTTHYYNDIPVIVTFHPTYLLRNTVAKKDAWADLLYAKTIYDML